MKKRLSILHILKNKKLIAKGSMPPAFGFRFDGKANKISGMMTASGFSLCYGYKVPGYKRTSFYTELSGGVGQQGLIITM